MSCIENSIIINKSENFQEYTNSWSKNINLSVTEGEKHIKLGNMFLFNMVCNLMCN